MEIGPSIEESDEADLKCQCIVTRIGDVGYSPNVTYHKDEDEMPLDSCCLGMATSSLSIDRAPAARR